jgi:hemerythrin-like domain-containing protein
MEEHRVIEQVIGCLENMVDLIRDGGDLDLQDANDAIDFIRNFADKCHHMKEEDQLFNMMVEKGFPREQGPIAVMLMEHDQGRKHVGLMSDSAEKASQGDEDAKKIFMFNAIGYANLLREHIMKEDNILYPMAVQQLDDGDMSVLMEKFDHVEHHDIGHGEHEKYLGIADRLGEKYGVKRTSDPQILGQGGFSCHGM